MKINDGMYIGANPAAVRDGAKSFALNIMYNDDGNTLINENGFEQLKFNFPETYGKCIGNIATPNSVVLFFANDYIVYIKNIKDADSDDNITIHSNFNFNDNYPIKGTFSYLKNENLVITFTEGTDDNANETRILYIDSIEKNHNATYDKSTKIWTIDSNTINLIPDIEYPEIDVKLTDGGLKAGGYQVAMAYKLNDGSYSDYSLLSPVYYATPRYLENIPIGGITKFGFTIDVKFKDIYNGFFKLAFIYKGESTEEAYETYDIKCNQSRISYNVTSVSKLKSISVDDIIIGNISYIKDNSQTSFNGYLLRGGVKVNDTSEINRILIEHPSIINNLIEIKTADESNNIVFDNITDLTKKDDNKLYNKVGFKDNEIYYFYLTLIDNKGKYINSYPIISGYDENNKAFYEFVLKDPSTKHVLNLGFFSARLKNWDANSALIGIKDISEDDKKLFIKQFDKISQYAIHYAKPTTDITNWISQCFTIRDIGISDVIGNNYREPFKSNSRFRIYPIEYLVTNTELPNFKIKPLYHNKEIKVCYDDLNNYVGYPKDVIKTIDISDSTYKNYANNLDSSLKNKAANILKAIQNNEKSNKSESGAGNVLGPWDRLSTHSKATINSTTTNVETGDGSVTINGPIETGDLIQSILSINNIEFYEDNYSESELKASNEHLGIIQLSASYYPINNSAVSNGGCDSSFKITISDNYVEKGLYGRNKKSNVSSDNVEIKVVESDETEDYIDVNDDNIKYKRTYKYIEYTHDISNGESNYYKQSVIEISYLDENENVIKTDITRGSKEELDDVSFREATSTGNDENNSWILDIREDTYRLTDELNTYNRGVVDLVNKLDATKIHNDLDMYAMDLVSASSIYSVTNSKDIILKGDTFPCLITQRCTCPSLRFNHTGDETHHNNSIYHCHRIVVSYFIKSRFNLLAIHGGSNSNSAILKIQNDLANKFDVNFIIDNMSDWLGTNGKKKEKNKRYRRDKNGLKVTNYLFGPNSDYSAIQELGYRDYTVDNFWHTEDGAAYEVGMNWKGFNDITQSKDYDNNITDFPARVVRSNVNNGESNDIGWRKYKADNYKDIPITKGSIVNLLSDAKSLYIQMLYTLYVTTSKDSLGQGDEGTYIGNSDIFEREPTEIIFKQTGKIGCNNRFSSIITRYGYFVCDNEQCAIFHVKGENDVTELSDLGFRDWFKENIQKIASNPYLYQGNFLTLDEYNKRLLFTSNVEDATNGQFTISYSLQNNLWSSFHSYIPIISFENRNGLFYIHDNKIFKTDAKNKCIYFEDIIYPSIAQFIYNEEPLISKALNHLEWRTQLVRNWIEKDKDTLQYIYNKSVDKLMIHTDTQSTKLLNTNVKKEWYDSGHLKYKAGRYIWHNIEDEVKFDKKEFLMNPNMLPFKWETLLNPSFKGKPWYELAKIHNPFMYITMIYENKQIDRDTQEVITEYTKDDNAQQLEFRLSDIDVVVTKDTRL
ncbi:MAG: hypothetical protein HDQ88_04695 [Clostridia bacterium]|nr:hypothetical protein [Clostridia bacterium]